MNTPENQTMAGLKDGFGDGGGNQTGMGQQELVNGQVYSQINDLRDRAIQFGIVGFGSVILTVMGASAAEIITDRMGVKDERLSTVTIGIIGLGAVSTLLNTIMAIRDVRHARLLEKSLLPKE